jgi:hypothetical protein
MRARLVAGTLAASALVALALLPDDPEAAATARARRGSIAIPTAPIARKAPGIEHRYTITLEHATDAFRIAVRGEWAVGVVAADERITTIRAELRAPHVVVNGQVNARPQLAQPYTFTLAADGHLVGLQLPKGLDPDSRAVLTAIAATAQHTDGRGPAWDAVETDSLGRHDVRYTRGDTGVRKTKLRYLDSAVDIGVLASTTDVVMRVDGWPARIDATEKLRVGLDQIALVVDGTVHLVHAGTHDAVAGAPADLEEVAVDATSAAHRDAADRELLDGASLADLLAELARVRNDSHASGYQYLRLVALFRLDADAARAAAIEVITGRIDEHAVPAVIGALGEAGTRDAQAALATLVDARALAAPARVHATLSLGLTPEPTDDTLRTLAQTSRTADAELASTATLGLGNAALRLRDRDPAGAAAYVDDLLARLRAAADDGTRITLLRALGNTGDPRILPALQGALAADAELVRAAATEALRFVPGIEALVAASLRDAASAVRNAAVFAAGFASLATLAPALTDAARTDPDPTIRRAIVDLAGPRMRELPALRAIVEYAAAHDTDAELREAARGMLAR